MSKETLEYTPLLDDPDGYILKLTKALAVSELGLTCTLVKGFKSDGASVPTVGWSVIRLYPTHPKLIRGAVAHDFLYLLVAARLIGRELADAVFLEIIKEDGLDFFRRQVVYRAVRISGGAHVPEHLTLQEQTWVKQCQLQLAGV